MKLNLSTLERDTLLGWKVPSKVQFPEEEILTASLGKHPGGDMDLSDNDIVILSSWAESAVDKNFGSGAITNITEKTLLGKINGQYAKIPGLETKDPKLPGDSTRVFQRPGAAPSGDGRSPALAKAIGIAVLLFLIAAVWHVASKRLGTPAAPAVRKPPATFTVNFVAGDALFKKDGAWVKIQIGDEISVADSVKTLKASEVTLAAGPLIITVEEERCVLLKDLPELR